MGARRRTGRLDDAARVVGDIMISDAKKHRNLFADALDPDDKIKRRKGYSRQSAHGASSLYRILSESAGWLLLGPSGALQCRADTEIRLISASMASARCYAVRKTRISCSPGLADRPGDIMAKIKKAWRSSG